jgi:uncharacterized protein (TIGR00290 family)
LHVLRSQDEVDVVSLLTTINQDASRVAMHAVRDQLLDPQAAAAGLPVFKVNIPSPCPNEVYEQAMSAAMTHAKADGIDAMAFGDLFLEDVRRYRLERIADTGIDCLCPLWGLNTADLARTMVGSGVKAHVTCIDPKQLDASFVGRTFDQQFLDDLPVGADPCGENGEFHSFANEGPMFKEPIPVAPGEVVERDGFVFADLLPG